MHLRLATKLLASIFIASSSVDTAAAAPSLVRGGNDGAHEDAHQDRTLEEEKIDIVSSDFVLHSCCYTHLINHQPPSTPININYNSIYGNWSKSQIIVLSNIYTLAGIKH